MKRTLVVGDIHGRFKALMQALARAGFVPDKDRLILLGDLCDRGPETRQVMEAIVERGWDVTAVLGNHDWWWREYLTTGKLERDWWCQGGEETMLSYFPGFDVTKYQQQLYAPVPAGHLRLLSSLKPYHTEERNGKRYLFVHGGYIPGLPISEQEEDLLVWDRLLWSKAYGLVEVANDFDEVFIGHTPVFADGPGEKGRVTNLDTGAGYLDGKLTVMDLDTRESWFSNPIGVLYPAEAAKALAPMEEIGYSLS